MNIYQKLQTARVELQGIKINKSGHNKFANYYYMELGDFLMPIQTLFLKHGLCGAISFSIEIATLTIVDSDDPTQSIVFTSPMSTAALKGCHEVQNLGAVETYQRRYLWLTAMEIVEHDALDATTGDDKKKPEPKKEPAKFNESNAFDDLESKEFTGADLAVVEQFKSANDIAELTKIMNSLADKKPFVAEFNKRMTELKKVG